jgi:hypothetical protein
MKSPMVKDVVWYTLQGRAEQVRVLGFNSEIVAHIEVLTGPLSGKTLDVPIDLPTAVGVNPLLKSLRMVTH